MPLHDAYFIGADTGSRDLDVAVLFQRREDRTIRIVDCFSIDGSLMKDAPAPEQRLAEYQRRVMAQFEKMARWPLANAFRFIKPVETAPVILARRQKQRAQRAARKITRRSRKWA